MMKNFQQEDKEQPMETIETISVDTISIDTMSMSVDVVQDKEKTMIEETMMAAETTMTMSTDNNDKEDKMDVVKEENNNVDDIEMEEIVQNDKKDVVEAQKESNVQEEEKNKSQYALDATLSFEAVPLLEHSTGIDQATFLVPEQATVPVLEQATVPVLDQALDQASALEQATVPSPMDVVPQDDLKEEHNIDMETNIVSMENNENDVKDVKDEILKKTNCRKRSVPKGFFREKNIKEYGETATIFCALDFYRIPRLSRAVLRKQNRSHRAKCGKRA